ncbi:MAG: hypothetical protein PHS59_18735, partial [Paludibacter sp.]|nr:hypothetical protein [Paludibacter sp.]
MATVKAFIKTYKTDIPAKVRFRLRAGREVDIEYTSDIEVIPKYWDSKIQSIKVSPFYSISDKLKIDSEISELRKLITTIFINVENSALLSSKYLGNQIKLLLDKTIAENSYEIKEEIIEQPLKEVTNFFDVFDQFLLRNDLSDERKESYAVVKNTLIRFVYIKRKSKPNFVLSLDDTDERILSEIHLYLKNEFYIAQEDKKFCSLFPKYKSNRPRGINTTTGMMIKVRAFFNWTIKHEYTRNYPFSKYTLRECVYGTPIFPTVEELTRIYEKDFSQRPFIETQRDIFVFQCMCGARIGDLIKFTRNNIIDGCIEYIPQKTKRERVITISVPLNSVAQKILNKYCLYDVGPILPFTFEQEYNRTIKTIFFETGITRNVTVLNTIT